MFPVYSGTSSAGTDAPPKKEDCVKCHSGQVNDIKTAGGRHRAVPCGGCHIGHPPTVKKPIEKCSRCHLSTRKAHFELRDCLHCHKNPHMPLNMSLADKGVCLNCHTQQDAQLREHKSRHSTIACTTCHPVHRQIPQCTQCHKPHSAEMVVADCKKCHKAHMPKPATYAADTPSKDCGSCHKKAFDLLSSSEAKHRPLACASCHQGRHKMIPDCKDCHGAPHAAGIMAKFPKCGHCHNTAHDVNNWPATQSKEEQKTKQ